MKQRVKKELREFAVIAGVFGILFATGLHTEVLAFAQRMVLATGIMNSPSTELVETTDADLNFSLINEDGHEIDVSSFEGKVIFMNLWATWCGPCIAEMPGIESLYQDYSNNPDVAFILLSLDESFDKAKKFKARKDFSFPIFTMVNRQLPDMYKKGSIPSTFVISRDALIVQEKLGMANYDTRKFRKFLDKLLAEP
jgi:thiol-disulfide isomerase/thioredoxin